MMGKPSWLTASSNLSFLLSHSSYYGSYCCTFWIKGLPGCYDYWLGLIIFSLCTVQLAWLARINYRFLWCAIIAIPFAEFQKKVFPYPCWNLIIILLKSNITGQTSWPLKGWSTANAAPVETATNYKHNHFERPLRLRSMMFLRVYPICASLDFLL